MPSIGIFFASETGNWIEEIRGDLLPHSPAVPLRRQAPARPVAAGRTRAA